MQVFTRANQALFDGDRGAVKELLRDQPHSGRALWLLACAADSDEERMSLLARVHATREQPYAGMASDILEREKFFAQEIARVPSWQSFMRRRGSIIVRCLIAVVFVAITLWIGSSFIYPPSPEPILPTLEPQNVFSSETDPANSLLADATVVVPTLIPTPNVTPIPFSQSANYMPLGALRILNVEYPAQWSITDGRDVVEAPPGTDYVALQYEFTCGTARAFCDNLPQAFLALELTDPALGLITASALQPEGVVAETRIASGSTVSLWAVFEVPQTQAPRRLIIAVDTNQDEEADTSLSLDLPR